MENDFRALLVGSPAVLALVSTRVYPDTYAQPSASPAIRYETIDGAEGLHMQGSDGLFDGEVQVDIRATSAASRKAVRDVVVALLHGFAGVQGATEFQLIQHISRLSRFEKTDAEAFYTDALRFHVVSRAAA